MSLWHNHTQVYTEQDRKGMKRLQITLDDELYQWITKEIKALKFGSYSHAINYALKQLKEGDSYRQQKWSSYQILFVFASGSTSDAYFITFTRLHFVIH